LIRQLHHARTKVGRRLSRLNLRLGDLGPSFPSRSVNGPFLLLEDASTGAAANCAGEAASSTKRAVQSKISMASVHPTMWKDGTIPVMQHSFNSPSSVVLGTALVWNEHWSLQLAIVQWSYRSKRKQSGVLHYTAAQQGGKLQTAHGRFGRKAQHRPHAIASFDQRVFLIDTN
jgi:hypothetical protein